MGVSMVIDGKKASPEKEASLQLWGDYFTMYIMCSHHDTHHFVAGGLNKNTSLDAECYYN